MDMTLFWTVVQALNQGFVQTLKLFAVTLVCAAPLGLVVSFGSMSRFAPLRWLTRTVVWVIRGTPLILQLYIIFYVPGMVMDRSPWPGGESGRFVASAVAFIINYACYFSEIYRGGIQGVPRGQQEAGLVLGMTKRQIFFKVTLLQMIKRIVPAGGHLGGVRLYEELPRLFGPHLAAVFHWRVFFGVQRSVDHSV